jgi:hypothetical protein
MLRQGYHIVLRTIFRSTPGSREFAFRFADRACQSVGTNAVLIPTPGSASRLVVDILRPDVPLLEVLDSLDRHGPQFRSVTNELECAKEICG